LVTGLLNQRFLTIFAQKFEDVLAVSDG